MFCDLHTHSFHSDGRVSPAAIIDNACAIGLGAVALTDHNTMTGLPEFVEAAAGRAVNIVPGVEVSTGYTVYGREREFHILALFVKPESSGKLNEMLEEINRRSEGSKRSLVERLRAGGYAIPDYDSICAAAGCVNINRAHVAAKLMEAGYVGSIKEAFASLLGEEHGFYVPAQRFDSLEAIKIIRETGAVAVLAHPLLKLDAEKLDSFLGKAVTAGLDGMEVYYSEYTPEQTEAAYSLAGKYGLAPSGGSDYHGDAKPHISLGAGTGKLAVPYECYLRLREIHTERLGEQT